MVYRKFTRVFVELVGCVLYVQKVKTKNGGGQVSKNISQEVVGKFWGDHQYKFTERNNETTIISHCWLDFKHGLFFVWIVVVCFFWRPNQKHTPYYLGMMVILIIKLVMLVMNADEPWQLVVMHVFQWSSPPSSSWSIITIMIIMIIISVIVIASIGIIIIITIIGIIVFTQLSMYQLFSILHASSVINTHHCSISMQQY